MYLISFFFPCPILDRGREWKEAFRSHGLLVPGAARHGPRCGEVLRSLPARLPPTCRRSFGGDFGGGGGWGWYVPKTKLPHSLKWRLSVISGTPLADAAAAPSCRPLSKPTLSRTLLPICNSLSLAVFYCRLIVFSACCAWSLALSLEGLAYWFVMVCAMNRPSVQPIAKTWG